MSVKELIDKFENKHYRQYVVFMKSFSVPFPLTKEQFLDILRTNLNSHKIYHQLFDICSYSLINTDKNNLSYIELKKYT